MDNQAAVAAGHSAPPGQFAAPIHVEKQRLLPRFLNSMALARVVRLGNAIQVSQRAELFINVFIRAGDHVQKDATL